MLKRGSLISLIFGVFFLISCSGTDSPAAPSKKEDPKDTVKYKVTYINSEHVTLGVPVDTDTTDDYYIVRSQYVVSYNKNKNEANWVAWKLVASDFGDVDRYSGNFIADTSLPASFYKTKHADYTNTGFDRGHIVRSEERTVTVADNKATFILSNVIPQTPDLNQGVWLKFEYFCQDLASKQNKDLYIYSGPIFTPGVENFLGYTKVRIPDSCFKIVVVLEKNQTLKDVNGKTPVYCVVMPNIDGVRKDAWETYSTTVRRIEKSTGYDFLNNVPQAIQDSIETKVSKK